MKLQDVLLKAMAKKISWPNLNAFAERLVRSVKQEGLSTLILFGEASLWRVVVS